MLDQSGSEIPYAIIENRGSSNAGKKYQFEIAGYEQMPGGEVITIRLPERHDPINVIRIVTSNKDFMKSVVLQGSSDMRSWKEVLSDSIWDFSYQVNFRKTELKIPKSTYRYYRLALTDVKAHAPNGNEEIRLKYRDLEFNASNTSTGKMHLDRIEADTSPMEMKAVYDNAILTRLSTRQDRNNTVVDIEGPVPFERISFEITNLYYFRNVDVYYSPTGKMESYCRIGSGHLFRFPFSGRVEAGNGIDGLHAGKGHYRIIIDNGSNPPLELKSIKVEWIKRNLYFIALADSRYRITLGDSSFRQPEYDITHFINQSNWQTHPAKDLELGNVIVSSGRNAREAPPKKETIEKIFLVSAVTLMVVVIGGWLYSIVRKAA